MAQQRRSGRERRGKPEEGGTRPQGPPSPGSRPDVTDDEISTRAYELYERRGGEHGRDWDDWLEAENELRRRRRAPGPTPS